MTFRIRWQPKGGTAGPFQHTLVEATDKIAAEAILRRDYPVSRISRIAIRCEAMVVITDGTKRRQLEPVRHRCFRFSQGKLCPTHAKMQRGG